jgi:hypothetical protein
MKCRTKIWTRMITAEESVGFTWSGVNISALSRRTRCSGLCTDFYSFAYNAGKSKIGKSLF